MITEDRIPSLFDAHVVDSSGDKIGRVGQIYVDPSGRPTWASVRTGLFGTSESFVPLDQAQESGDEIRVPYTKDFVKDAPRIDVDGALETSQEDELYRYYRDTFSSGFDADGTTSTGTAGTTGYDTNAHGTVGHDVSGPTTDDAMTRSEEHLEVGTERVESGRARLRKYVVTEQESVTVPVSHEEVRIEREPITDANAGAAYDGPAISEEEHEVVLHAERPVVAKEATPVERVRLDTETVTDTERVQGEVRKEEIEVEGAEGTTGRGTHR